MPSPEQAYIQEQKRVSGRHSGSDFATEKSHERMTIEAFVTEEPKTE